MLYTDNLKISLNKNTAFLLFLFIFCLFFGYEFILFSRLSGENRILKSFDFLLEVRVSTKMPLVERSLYYQKALKSLKGAISSNPYDSRPYFEYGEIVNEIAKDPDLAVAVNIARFDSLGESQLDYRNLAKEKYAEAILREPANGVYHQRLGLMYGSLNDDEAAENELKKAIELDPQNISINVFLSRYYFLKEREEEFLFYILRAIELQRKFYGEPMGGEVRVFLKSIGREDLIQR